MQVMMIIQKFTFKILEVNIYFIVKTQALNLFEI
jgi:hypothetical protein